MIRSDDHQRVLILANCLEVCFESAGSTFPAVWTLTSQSRTNSVIKLQQLAQRAVVVQDMHHLVDARSFRPGVHLISYIRLGLTALTS